MGLELAYFNLSPRGRLTLEIAAPRGTSAVDYEVASDLSRCSGLESLDPREDGWGALEKRQEREVTPDCKC